MAHLLLGHSFCNIEIGDKAFDYEDLLFYCVKEKLIVQPIKRTSIGTLIFCLRRNNRLLEVWEMENCVKYLNR